MEAAREEFAERGFAGARTQRIAARAGVNKQLLFYYFGSKRGLYEAVLSHAGDTLTRPGAKTPAAAGGPDGVRGQLAAALERAVTNPELARVLIRGAQSPDGIEAARSMFSHLVADVRTAISAGQGIGYFKDTAEPERAARQAAVLVLGYIAFAPALGSDGSPQERRAWLDGVVELLMSGLTW